MQFHKPGRSQPVAMERTGMRTIVQQGDGWLEFARPGSWGKLRFDNCVTGLRSTLQPHLLQVLRGFVQIKVGCISWHSLGRSIDQLCRCQRNVREYLKPFRFPEHPQYSLRILKDLVSSRMLLQMIGETHRFSHEEIP